MPHSLIDLVGARPLGLARIIIGTAAVIRSGVAWTILRRFDDPEVLRIAVVDGFVDPASTPAGAFVAAWAVSAIAFTVGWRVPASGLLTAGSIVLYGLLDSQAYSNHLYLMALLVILLTLAPADSALAVRGGAGTVPLWPVELIKLQVSIVYLFAALTKLNEGFLSGAVLAGTLNGGIVPFPESLRTPGFLSVVAAGAVFTELFVATFLWSRRFRPAALVLGGGLHLFITLLIGPTLELVVFSLLMLGTYPLFLDRRPITVVWDDECGSCRDWIGRFTRFDLLRLLVPIGKSDRTHGLDPSAVSHAMHTIVPRTGEPEIRAGFDAVNDVLERTVPGLWVAPLLRLPGVAHLGRAWYRRQALRRGCELA